MRLREDGQFVHHGMLGCITLKQSNHLHRLCNTHREMLSFIIVHLCCAFLYTYADFISQLCATFFKIKTRLGDTAGQTSILVAKIYSAKHPTLVL
jgi:hypothetical protein